MGLQQRLGDTFTKAIPLDFAPADARIVAPAESALKRLLDVSVATLVLVLLSPMLLLTAVLIKLDSDGPAFFRQTRLGLHGKPFDILKFRSMSVLENGNTIVQAKRNDPRITRIGRFLRKTSIDELPQLINVLKGEMSLVGPRPHARAHDEYYGARIAGYSLRQQVKPGITGWAQVLGFRGETPTLERMRRRVECDLWYVRHVSLALDLEILARTALEILRPRNAH
ncbi:MAG TPA: exopolysaccharide biosynthesis polyprenyl glycosylphosphotransferase [Rhizomicrobium sp.]